LSVQLSGAHVHDSQRLRLLVTTIPTLRGKVGRPRQRPAIVQGDRAYGSAAHHRWLGSLGITDRLARQGTPHGSGLGKTRWVIERSLSWLHQFRRLRIRYERRADIHQAFLILGCALICHRTLENSFC
jgi:transposase